MPFYEREEKILNALMEKESVSIRELSEKLYVSIPTLRRDMIKLEALGKIMRTHGGATLIKKAADENIPLFLREQEQNSAKDKIAQKAVTLVKDGDTIFLDGSTSAYSIIPLLAPYRKLTVITSSAKASFLLGQMDINNICTGGRMLNRSFSYIGEDAERTVRSYNADIVFFSCRGLSMDGRLSDNSIEENRLRRAMILQSNRKVLLLDSSKLDKLYLNTLCHLSDLNNLLCDIPLPIALMRMLKNI